MKKAELKLILPLLLKYHFETIKAILDLAAGMSVVYTMAIVSSEENTAVTLSFEYI